MAAPTMSKNAAKGKTGEKLNQKQKKEFKKQKNVLFNPFPFKWPVLDKYYEEKLVDDLQSLLKSLPVQLPKRPASYFKDKKKGKEEAVSVSEEDKEQCQKRRELRSQFVCGVREVTKGLEKDNLDLVIVCRSTRPSIITKHLIPLAASRGCPALCIPDFNPKIAPLLGVTSLVAFGFKKLPPGNQSKFSEFIEYAKKNAPPLDTPWVNQSLGIGCQEDSVPDTNLDETSVQDKTGGDSAAAPGKSKNMPVVHSPGEFISLSTAESGDDQSDNQSVNEQKTPSKETKNSSGFISLSDQSGNSSGFISLTSVTSKSENSVNASCKTADSSVSTESRSRPSASKDSSDNKVSSLVFPLDGPPPFVAKGDYSYLYVFKKEGKFGDDFIPLDGQKGVKRDLECVSSGSEQESVDDEDSGVLGLEEPVAKKPKHSANTGKSDKYRPALIKAQIPNANRKKKKQNKRKAK